jgi:hypothetical protein
MREEREAHEGGPWAWPNQDDSQRSPNGSSTEPTSRRWVDEAVGSKSMNEKNKEQALEACADQHLALVGCLKKQGFFVNCSEPQKAFGDCYATHRGIQGKKMTEVFAGPSQSNGNQSR